MPESTEEGFDMGFLGDGDKFKIETPIIQDNQYELIDYTHFSTFFNQDRRLALYCACNIPKHDQRIDIERPKKFRKDTNSLKKEEQVGDDFYKCKENDHPVINNKNLLDRGHVIRREYPQWGTKQRAEIASKETFFFTNIAPQHYLLNQGDWKKLEDYVIDKVQNKVSVLSGCIFQESDPVAVYTGHESKEVKNLHIPLKFWKVVYYVKNNQLHRIGFVLSQEMALKKLDFIYFPSDRVRSKAFVKDPFSDLDEDLIPYIVDVDAIEFAASLTFTPAIENINSGETRKSYFMNTENQSRYARFSLNLLENLL
ncbi:hypothetical protein GTQ34_13845 [Muricauda sp. JGD-17]|uniref:DNA/RNA non-specific endonuclease n=1 Tax=Flagellimonas ochracea TaxID=2696472 RepID=A0A964TDU5_9FLAO|nr:DNA/RNA non-specific endonuclease [Allomuricauda ochracea]NAY93002.1 hypothetical protein [Allomuricauda ochracea]